EVVAHGETGLLVPPDDPPALAAALLELLTDPLRAERMGRAGWSRLAERFGERAMLDATQALYNALLGRRRDGAGESDGEYGAAARERVGADASVGRTSAAE